MARWSELPLGNRFVKGLRQRSALLVHRRIHRITHRLPVALRPVEKGRVLVVAPHMDDEVIGPGGTLALHQNAGSTIDVVFCARGATPEADRTRRAEARACGAFMEFAGLHYLDFPEGALSLHEPALADALASFVRRFEPDVVFCPFVADHHRDHTACSMAVASALGRAAFRGEVWAYEVWSPLWPNVAVDISAVVDTKRRAIAFHESQTAGLHYVEGALGLNRYRGLRVYVDYAEAFFVGSLADFRAATDAMTL
ncbi:MAG: PIG-L deacetylase family protein [Myxococcota bacterium]